MLALQSPLARADFNDGVVAFLSGDYDEAFLIFQALAETESSYLAMYYLGVMLHEGRGVAPDHKQAVRWFKQASEVGIPQAQNRLARMYRDGTGVTRDYEQAYAWYRTAVAGGHAPSEAELPMVVGKLSASERAEADKLARRYIREYRPDQEEVTGGAAP